MYKFPLSWFICKFCKATFSTREKLIFHKKSQHKPTLTGIQADLSTSSTECGNTKKVNANLKRNLVIPIIRLDKIEMAKILQKFPNLRCNYTSFENNAGDLDDTATTGDSVNDEGQIKNTNTNEEQPNQSNHSTRLLQCASRRKSLGNHSLLNSQKKINDEKRLFKCNDCERSFLQKCGLSSHKRVHVKYRRFKCKHCGKRYAQLKGLKNHSKLHTGENLFKCSTCNKCFTKSSLLRYHEMIHTREQRFKCSYCEKCFSQMGDLKSHEMLHTAILFQHP